MAANGDDLSMDDMALAVDLLPGFLDELNDEDLPSPSGVVSPSHPLSFAEYLAPPEAPHISIFAQLSVYNAGPMSTRRQKGLSGNTTGAAQHFAPLSGLFDLEMRSEPSSEAVTEEKVGLHRPPTQNSTRKRQKEELNYLRNKVQSLEQELEAKRRVFMASKGQNKESKTLTVQINWRRRRALRWQRIAKNQLVEKQRAEMQNLQLRESLVDQIKLARSLQKLLKKNFSRKDEGTEVAQLQARLEFSNCGAGSSEDLLYENLLKDMDTVYAEVDSICARHPVMQRMEEGSDVSSLHVGETEALYLEVTSSKVIPFGMEETCSAVWRCLSTEHLKLADGTYHGVASSPDSIRAKAITTLRANNTTARLQMRFAMKKYVEQERVVITLESASDSVGPRDLLHGLRMMQRAWIVIRPVPFEPEDEEHVDDSQHSEETIIQLCMRLTPSLSAGVLNMPGQRTGAITELLLAAVHRNIGWLFQTVENILMEHDFGAMPR